MKKIQILGTGCPEMSETHGECPGGGRGAGY